MISGTSRQRWQYAAGTDMKVISTMLRHSSHKITADTYTSVLPEVAREAAEAVVSLVPPAKDASIRRRAYGGGATTPRPLCPDAAPERSSPGAGANARASMNVRSPPPKVGGRSVVRG
jgi:hypothetical protein